MSKGKRVEAEKARSYVEPILKFMLLHPGIGDPFVTGSLRRGHPFVNDVDLTATLTGRTCVQTLWDEMTRLLRLTYSRGGEFEKTTQVGVLKVEIRFFRPTEVGAALLFTTGSHKFNVAMRSLAKKRDLLLNRYGLWTRKDKPEERELIASETEQEIFDALALPYVPPEERDSVDMLWRVMRRLSA